MLAQLFLFSEGAGDQASEQAFRFRVGPVLSWRFWFLGVFFISWALLLLVWFVLVDFLKVLSFAFFEAGVLFVTVDDLGLLLLQKLLPFLILSDPNELGVGEALAEIELLMAGPAEVLGADMTVVGLRALTIHSVRRVALWAADTLAESECQPLALSLLRVEANTDDTILAAADEAMRHPFLLVDELQVAFTDTADRFFVHVLDPFNFGLMLLLGQVEKRQQDVQGHDVLAPFLSLALHQVHLYLVSLVKLVLNGFCYLGLNAINASLVHALGVENDARLLMSLTDRAQGVLIRNQFLLLLSHALVQLRVDGVDVISVITD